MYSDECNKVTYFNSILGNRDEEYYTIKTSCDKHILYHASFPVEWALNEDETGPLECLNCLYYGSYEGVIIGYCVNCAQNSFNGERGQGFIEKGIEYTNESGEVKGCRALDTYLKGVDLCTIGEKFVDLSSKETDFYLYNYSQDEAENSDEEPFDEEPFDEEIIEYGITGLIGGGDNIFTPDMSTGYNSY